MVTDTDTRTTEIPTAPAEAMAPRRETHGKSPDGHREIPAAQRPGIVPDDLEDQPPATSVRKRIRGSWLYTLPILYKVLIANASIVVGGAILGTTITYLEAHDSPAITLPTLIVAFVVVGFPLSVIVNYAVLRAALQPVDELQRAAARVRGGDLSARAEETTFVDPQIQRLTATFNGTLDELERDRQQIRSLAADVIRAQEKERQRIARELHDDTAQLLFAQLLTITSLRNMPGNSGAETVAALEDMSVQALESVRRLALELRPPSLDDLGLYDAVGAVCSRVSEAAGIDVRFEHRGPRTRLPKDLELVVYRIVQEALTNVSKHAAATRAWVTIERELHQIRIIVDDNGVGFDPDVARESDDLGLGLGIFGMEERVSLTGGLFAIGPRSPRGTSVSALIPVPDSTLPAPTTLCERPTRERRSERASD